MPSQPQITDYFTVSRDSSANSNGDEPDVPANPMDRLMQFVQQRVEIMDRSNRTGMAHIESLIHTAFTKMEEENHQIRIKLREAEMSIAESRGEVARLTEEIAELRNVVHRQEQRDVGEQVEEEGNRNFTLGLNPRGYDLTFWVQTQTLLFINCGSVPNGLKIVFWVQTQR